MSAELRNERIESVFTAPEIADMRARYAAEKEARAAQVCTATALQLLHVSRTVIDKDRHTLTVVDGDILDYIKAIESALLDERDAAIQRAEEAERLVQRLATAVKRRRLELTDPARTTDWAAFADESLALNEALRSQESQKPPETVDR